MEKIGEVKSEISNEIWMWEQLQMNYHIPARHGHRMIEVNNKILVLFGSSSHILQSDLHIYDCKTNIWFQPEQKGTIPTRASFSIAAIGTKIIIFGGFIGINNNFLLSNKLYELETTNWEWKEIVPFSSVPSERLGASFTAIDNKIYMFGGLTTNNFNVAGSSRKYHNELFILSKILDQYCWQIIYPKRDEPPPRESHSAVSYKAQGKNWLIIYGGTYNNKRLDDLWIYDIDYMHWTKPTISGNPPAGRSLHSCNIVGSKMIIYGGCVEAPSHDNAPDWRSTSSMGCLNLETMTWETDDLICGYKKPLKRDSHQTAVLDNKIYLFSGKCTTGKQFHPNYLCYNDFWKLEIKDASKMFEKSIPENKVVPTNKLSLPKVIIMPNTAHHVNKQLIRTPGGTPCNAGNTLLNTRVSHQQIQIRGIQNNGGTQIVPNNPLQVSGLSTYMLVNNNTEKNNVGKNDQPIQFITVPIMDDAKQMPRMTLPKPVNIQNQVTESKQYYIVVPKSQLQQMITSPIPVKTVNCNVMNMRATQNIPGDNIPKAAMMVGKKNTNSTETISSSVISSTQGSATSEMTANVRRGKKVSFNIPNVLEPKNTPENVLTIKQENVKLDDNDIESSISSSKKKKFDAVQSQSYMDQMSNSSSSTTLSMHDDNQDYVECITDMKIKQEDTQNDNIPNKKIRLEPTAPTILEKAQNLNAMTCSNGIKLSWLDPPNANGKIIYKVFLYVESKFGSGFYLIYSGSSKSCIADNEVLETNLKNEDIIYFKIVAENEAGKGDPLIVSYLKQNLGNCTVNLKPIN